MNDSRRRWCTLLTSSTVSGMQMRYSLIRTIALLVISEWLPERLDSRWTVCGAPAAAAATKAVGCGGWAWVELSEGRFGAASVGRWLAGWLVDWPERDESGRKKKQQKHRIISDQQKRKYTKHGCPTILFNIFVVHRTVSVPTAVSVYGVVVHSHGAHRPDSGGDAGRDLSHGT